MTGIATKELDEWSCKTAAVRMDGVRFVLVMLTKVVIALTR